MKGAAMMGGFGARVAPGVLGAIAFLCSSCATAAPAGTASAPASQVAPVSAIVVPATIQRGVAIRLDAGDSRLESQPGGPYAALVFRDGAAGDRLAVIHPGPLGNSRDGAWTLNDRWWQEPLWSADANAFVWSSDGAALYISTGGRGSGGVFRLDLQNGSARRLWPNDEASTPEQGAGRSCEIMSADAARRLLRVRYQPAANQRPIAVDVWME